MSKHDPGRRRLLRRSLELGASGGAWLSAAPSNASPRAPGDEPWRHEPGAPFSNYGQPSAHENDVIRWISVTSGAPTNGVSWTPLHELDGIITPNGLHYERHHNGVPNIDPARHELRVFGQVQRPHAYSLDALLRYPRTTRTLFIECGGNSNAAWNSNPIQTAAGYFHGLVSCSEWTGVPLRVLLAECEPQPTARWLIAEGADAFNMTISIPLEKAKDDCLLALFQNGERIRPEQGYPVRLIVPGWEGVLHVKWLRSLFLTDQPVMARNETARYTELMPDGRARMFTFEMAAKSLITMPSAGMHLPTTGYYEISGLAWSGKGRIVKVEVSSDAGATWSQATLSEPVLPQCFTRFRLPWEWRGRPLVLQSRAIDDSGYVQPTRTALLAARGRYGYFHHNAIVSWAIDAEGHVTHVYPDDENNAAHSSDPDDPFNLPWE